MKPYIVIYIVHIVYIIFKGKIKEKILKLNELMDKSIFFIIILIY